MKLPRAPNGLKNPGKRFWRKILTEYDLQDTHDFERLAMAAKCLDDLSDIEAKIETDGRFITNRYNTIVEHPGCKAIRDGRMLFIKIIRELGFDLTSGPESRPPRKY